MGVYARGGSLSALDGICKGDKAIYIWKPLLAEVIKRPYSYYTIAVINDSPRGIKARDKDPMVPSRGKKGDESRGDADIQAIPLKALWRDYGFQV